MQSLFLPKWFTNIIENCDPLEGRVGFAKRDSDVAKFWVSTKPCFHSWFHHSKRFASGAMESAGREPKRSRSSFDSVCLQNHDDEEESDIDSNGDEEAVLLAAAAWSEKQTGSARVAPSDLRESWTLPAQYDNNVEEEYVTKLRGSSETLSKLKTMLENNFVESILEVGEGGSSVLVCEFPSMETYEKILGSQLGDYDGIESIAPIKGVKKRKRVESMKEPKRVSNRRAAIMMKPKIVEERIGH